MDWALGREVDETCVKRMPLAPLEASVSTIFWPTPRAPPVTIANLPCRGSASVISGFCSFGELARGIGDGIGSEELISSTGRGGDQLFILVTSTRRLSRVREAHPAYIIDASISSQHPSSQELQPASPQTVFDRIRQLRIAPSIASSSTCVVHSKICQHSYIQYLNYLYMDGRADTKSPAWICKMDYLEVKHRKIVPDEDRHECCHSTGSR